MSEKSSHLRAEIHCSPGDLVESVSRTLRVIEAFDDDNARLTVSDIAHRAELSRPAARRFALTLVHQGYADTDGKQFWLLPRVLRLGQSYLASARLPTLVQPVIQRTALQCGETVNFSLLDGHEVVYLARSGAQGLVSVGFQVGVRAPAHVVAPGVVLLSTRNDVELDDWIAAHSFTRFTPETVTDPMVFKDHVMRARRLDFWIGDQQGTMGMLGIATVVRDRKGDAKGAIGVTVQERKYDRQQLQDQLLPVLRSAAMMLRPLL